MVEENDHLSITLNTGVLLEAGISESQDLKLIYTDETDPVWRICSSNCWMEVMIN